MVKVKEDPLGNIITSIQKLHTDLLATYDVDNFPESKTLQLEAAKLADALVELQRSLNQQPEIQQDAVDDIESPTKRCLLEAKQVLEDAYTELTRDGTIGNPDESDTSHRRTGEATAAVQMCFTFVQQSLQELREVNHHGQGPGDGTYSTADVDSDALSSYEEGIVTPRTPESDEPRVSSATSAISEPGLFALLSSKVRINVLADWYPHMDRLPRLEDWKCQEDVLTNYQDGTGLWLLENPVFKAWVDGNEGAHICRLYGPAGVGKSTLTAFIVDHLQKVYDPEDTCIASIFIDPSHPRNPRGHLSSPLFGQLVHQLLQRPLNADATVYQALRGYLETQGVPTGSECDMFGIFRKLIERYSKVFVVIDGLDEWPEKQVSAFFKSWQLLPETGKFKLLVTSKKSTLNGLDGERTAMVEILPNKEDVRKFAKARIHGNSELLKYVEAQLERVVEEIVEKSQGSFLLAYFYICFLIAQMHLVTIEDALPLLNSDLSAMVHNIIDAILIPGSENGSEFARAVLLYITYSPMALTCEEITEVISAFSEREVDVATVSVALNTVMRSGLVLVEPKRGGYISLAHKVVREVIEADSGRFLHAHYFLTTCCYSYLENALESFKKDHDNDIVRSQSEGLLFTYALANWGVHAWKAESDESALKKILLFIEHDELIDYVIHLSHTYQPALRPESLRCGVCVDKEHGGVEAQPGHRQAVIAAYFGLARVLGRLTSKHGWSKEDLATGIRNGEDQTLFSIAVGNGHETLAECILSRCQLQVEYKQQCNVLMTPLARAAAGGHTSVITLLLTQHGLNPNLPDISRRTALHHAVDCGDEGTVELLLSRGDVNPNLRADNGETPLMIAIQGQKMGIVRLLLARKDVDVNINAGWQTPLIEAVFWRNLEMVGALLRREDVDVNIRTTAGTPLQVARNCGDLRVVSLLEGRWGINKDIE